jgi:hypothetical protein
MKTTAITLQKNQRIDYNQSQIQGFDPNKDRYLPMTGTIAEVFVCGVEVQLQMTNGNVLFLKCNDLVTLATTDKKAPMQTNVNSNPLQQRSATGRLISIE